MKKEIFVGTLIILIFFSMFSFVSAGLFSGVWTKVTGKATIFSTENVEKTANRDINSLNRNISLGCTDSDEGKTYYMKGITRGIEIETREYVEKVDSCITEIGETKNLLEYYCLENQVASIIHGCSVDCNDGACLQREVCDETYLDTASNKLYVGEEINDAKSVLTKNSLPNLLKNGVIYTGNLTRSTSALIIGSKEIENSTSNGDLEYSQVLIEVGTDPINYLYGYEILFSGSLNFTEMNGHYIELLGEYYRIEEDSTNQKIILRKMGENSFILTLEENGAVKINEVIINGVSVEIDGGSSVHRLKMNFVTQDQNPDHITVEKTYTNPVFNNLKLIFESYDTRNGAKIKINGCIINNAEINMACYDSDRGNNYYKKGILTWELFGEKYKLSDYCLSSSILGEYSCGTNEEPYLEYYRDCPNGCENSTCLEPPNLTDRDCPNNSCITIQDIVIECEGDICTGGINNGAGEAMANPELDLTKKETKPINKIINFFKKIFGRS